MRIVLLVTDLERGGTPLRVARLAHGLRRLGQRVAVGCLSRRGPVSDELEANGIRTFACDARSARDWRALGRLAGHLRRLRPDIVHASLVHANVAARIVGAWANVPVVTSTATIEVERSWHAWAERATRSLDCGMIVNSRALARHVVRTFGRSARRVFIVPPSVDKTPAKSVLRQPGARAELRTRARAQLQIAPHEFLVLWFGRFDPVKRLDIVVRCAEVLNDVPVRVVLAGDGADRPRVESLIRTGTAGSRITLTGWQTDMAPLLAAADAFMLPSLTEGTPNALLEALAAGLPVVARDIPPIREFCPNQERGLLITDDHAAAYAEAIRGLYRDAELRTRMSTAAMGWAEATLTLDAAARATLAAYEISLGDFGANPRPAAVAGLGSAR